MNKFSRLHGIGLQFFADPPADPPASTTQDPPPADPPAKTFTQEDVNRMLANEKRQGRQALMKELGLDINDKDAAKKAKGILDSHKTQSQLNSEALATEKDARNAAEKRAEAAERKIAVMSLGCKKEFMDEVTALASAKVTDDLDFEAAVKEVKTKMPTLFEDDDDGDEGGAGGTGKGQGHKRKSNSDKPGSLGARLAQGASASVKENPYFKN